MLFAWYDFNPLVFPFKIKKMNKYTSILFLFLPMILPGQTMFQISNFSEKYTAKLFIDQGQEEDVFKKGKLLVLEKASGARLLSIESEEFAFDVDQEGMVTTNVVELPYGEQSLVICRDFNFDGIKDLALMDGQFSCYHGPSYQIYLESNGRLLHSPEFTRLAQNYCGMFRVDNESKMIHVSAKSGCCWHEYTSFRIVNGLPQKALVVEEDASNYPFVHVSTTEWKGGKAIKTDEKKLDLEGLESELMSFKLAQNGKRLVLFVAHESNLHYALLKPGGQVEFSFPIDSRPGKADFELNQEADKLTFRNGNAVYQVYESKKQGRASKAGVLVRVNGKEYDLQGDLGSIRGSLRDIQNAGLENVASD